MYVLEKLKPYAAQLGFLKSERMGKIFTLLYNTKEKVDIAASLPGTPEEVSQKSGYPLEVVKQIIKELHLKGAINEKVADKGAFRLFPGMIELRDATTLAPDTGVELLKLWDDLIRNELPQLLPAFEANGIPPMRRVIPIEETVESEGKSWTNT